MADNYLTALLLSALLGAPLSAQTAAEYVTLGDREIAAMNPSVALVHYRAAIAANPKNADALWRASRAAIDLGEFDNDKRDSLYRLGEQYARWAVQEDSTSSMAHFAVARALGRRALMVGKRERVKFAADVRHHAIQALQYDSLNPGALHVLGVWHAEIMRLNGFERFVARNLLGGKVFSEASWADASRLLERAVALQPDWIVHRLDLGDVYRDRGDKLRAREQYERALQLKLLEYNDRHYQRLATEALRRLGTR